MLSSASWCMKCLGSAYICILILHTRSLHACCLLHTREYNRILEELLPDFALHASAVATDLVYDLSGTAHADMPLQTYLCNFTSAAMQV